MGYVQVDSNWVWFKNLDQFFLGRIGPWIGFLVLFMCGLETQSTIPNLFFRTKTIGFSLKWKPIQHKCELVLADSSYRDVAHHLKFVF
jgi:hypothetical protein